jgi:spore coat protein JB
MNERNELLRKLQSADFAAYDLLLYLDTHPCCQTALDAYKEKCAEAKKLREEYEEKYSPLSPCASSEDTPWQWIKNPWNWEKSE